MTRRTVNWLTHHETIEADDGVLPVLLPTSEVAGRMAPVIAGQLLESVEGGRGILLSGIPGVPPAAVVILGAGILGTNAARTFLGIGAEVTVLDRDLRALQVLDRVLEGRVGTMLANPYNIAKAVAFADVLVGAVAIPGERAPVLVTRSMVRTMQPRAVILMISINSAIEVDLTGQVAADSIGPRFYSGVGGQVDFVRGAARSRGGKPIIALPATARDGAISRIVGQLKPGAGVTTSRNDVRYVVTEHGVADLYGKTIRERAETLISIAAPEFREDLRREAHELHYL